MWTWRQLASSGELRGWFQFNQEVMGRIQGDKQPVIEIVLETEALRNAISADREEAFFNVGYEHGLADSLARARRGSIRLSNEVQQFVTETRERSRAWSAK